MIKNSIFYILILWVINPVFSQHYNPCFSDEISNKFMLKDANYKKNVEVVNALLTKYSKTKFKNENQVITIPVVVHVVWNAAEENISDAQVQSQIDVLNEDFRRMNADTTKTRKIFKDRAADVRIEFCLAKQDEKGNNTTGITHTKTSATSFGANDAVKFDSLGGKTGWNPDNYLNIWVCKLNFANGYAYYPGIPAKYDGVVLHYLVCGRIGKIVAPYKGRTGTHEVGHWLGLYHTFYDYCKGLSGKRGCLGNHDYDCTSEGDFICDSPADTTASYSCDTTQNSVKDFPTDYPDMIENYMDYAPDTCRNLFTKNQAARMRAMLFSFRASLLNSLGCQSSNYPFIDVAITDVSRPFAVSCDSNFRPVVAVTNKSNKTITSLKFEYGIDNPSQQNFNYSTSIKGGGSEYILLPKMKSSSGNHTLHIKVMNGDTTTDPDLTNNVWLQIFSVSGSSQALTIPLVENFERNKFPPDGWTINNPDNKKQWEAANKGGYGKSKGAVYFPNFYNNKWQTFDGFISPVINMQNTTGYYLYYDYAYSKPKVDFYSDSLKILYTTDCASSWKTLAGYSGKDHNTAATMTVFDEFIPSDTNWKTDSIPLDVLSGSPLVQLQFVNIAAYGNDVYLDNIKIKKPGQNVGMDEHENISPDIKIFPNPTQNIFMVEMSDPKDAFAILYTLDGRQVYSCALKSSVQIDIRLLPADIYILKIILPDRVVVKQIKKY